MKINFLLSIALVVCFSSCKKNNPGPYIGSEPTDNNTWKYDGTGDGNVGTNNDVDITFPIQSNLNVNGTAHLSTNTFVRNDLNLNESGKVIVNAISITDTIYLNGNVNVNDSLLINRGIVKVARDFNINNRGFVNCSDSAQIIIGGSLNQAGTLWGNKLVKAKVKNINNPEKTFDESFFIYMKN